MDWMLGGTTSLPRKRRSKKNKPDGCVDQPTDITTEGVTSSQILDLNEVPSMEEPHASPVVQVRRRGPRKKKIDVPDVNSSVTGDQLVVKVVRRRASKAKAPSVVAEGCCSTLGCEIAGPSQSDPSSVVDAVKPAKRTPRKYAPRKKKVPDGDKHQCHEVGSDPVIVPDHDMGNAVHPEVNAGLSHAQPLSVDSVISDPSSVRAGLAPLLSALCDHADSTSSEVRSAGTKECGNVVDALAPEVIDLSQLVEQG